MISIKKLVIVVTAPLLVVACSAQPDSLMDPEGAGSGNDQGGGAADQGGLQCTTKPEGARSYVGFDGKPLEATRTNENTAINRARVKPYVVMEGEYQRVLGVIPPSLKTSAGTFDPPPARWAEEASHSGVSMNTSYEIAYEACRMYTKTAADFAAAPTADSAGRVCGSLMRKAWSRTASPEEIGSCTDLAVTGLASEPDARKRWSYVCAAVLSSSQFLTF